jgi:DNA repair exonuclease SbcCD ATPase subunit
MAFTINDLQDLTRLLRERPEWLSEVQRIVLTDELLAMPRELAELRRDTDKRFAELAEALRQLTLRFEEAQRRNDERFAELAEAQRRNDERLAELAEFQRRAEVRFAELTEAIKQLTARFEEAQRRNDERFAELAEFQRRAEVRFAELTEAIKQLTARFEEAQRRNDERFAELAEFQRRAEVRFAELTEAIKQLTARFEEAQRRNDERFAELAEAIRQLALRFDEYRQRTDDQIADMRGKLLEIEYRNKAGAIFGGRLRRPQVVDAGELWELLKERQLDESEIQQVVAADLIIRGKLYPPYSDRELWLVVEISSVIDRNDVARAARRAALLRKAGLLSLPVAAGQRLTQGAADLSEQLRVVLAKNGGLAGWDVSLSNALGYSGGPASH